MTEQEISRKRRRILSKPDGFSTSTLQQQQQQQQQYNIPTFKSSFHDSTKPKSLLVQPIPPLKKVTLDIQTRPQPPPPLPHQLNLRPLKPPVVHQESLNNPNLHPVKPLPPSVIFKTDHPSHSTLPLKPLHKHATFTPETHPVDTKEMKPLTTTYFAAFSDLISAEDSSELSSIMLRDYNSTSDTKQDEVRDLWVSPQKSKYVRFVAIVKPLSPPKFYLYQRGGLAARASGLYNKSHTSLSLWRTAMESQPSLHSAPGISFRVCQVLHTISNSTHGSNLLITLSRVATPVKPFSENQLVYVIIKSPSSSKRSTLCNFTDMGDGCLLHIWRPWHEVGLDSASTPPQDIPCASLPLPPSSSSSSGVPADERVHNIALLCSRFSIVQEK